LTAWDWQSRNKRYTQKRRKNNLRGRGGSSLEMAAVGASICQSKQGSVTGGERKGATRAMGGWKRRSKINHLGRGKSV